MELPTLPEGYFWDQYTVAGSKGHALVTQLRKKLFWDSPVPSETAK